MESDKDYYSLSEVTALHYNLCMIQPPSDKIKEAINKLEEIILKLINDISVE